MKSHKSFSTNTIFLIFCSLQVSQVACLDTLKQGEQLNFTSHLVSQNNNFTLGFYTPEFSGKSYIAVWYTVGAYHPLWIGNRDDPVGSNSSPILTISDTGAMIIMHKGRNITLYAGGSSRDVSATLLDSGNFVVKDGSSGTVLWQSFDYPTDTLIPGMKLGFDRRTGRKWTLTSWFGSDNPASGPFTLEWDASGRGLVVRGRGVIFWTSGAMKDYYGNYQGFKYQVKSFENLKFEPDPEYQNYNFTNVTTQNEEYFTYSLFQDPASTPEYVISGWRLAYNGSVSEITVGRASILASVTRCYGYSRDEGCEIWQQPRCRNSREAFALRSGTFKENGVLVDDRQIMNSSLSFIDCRQNCWNNCTCFGFYWLENSPACLYWTGKDLVFDPSLDNSDSVRYVLIASTSLDKGSLK